VAARLTNHLLFRALWERMEPEDIPVEFVRELVEKFIKQLKGVVSEERVMRDYEYMLKKWEGWDDLGFSISDTRRWEYAFYLMRADYINCRIAIVK